MTKISDDRLRALYAPIAQTRLLNREGCPSPEDIQALVRREGDEDARLALLDHVMMCADCRKEFNLLRAVEKGGEQLQTEERSKGQRKGSPFFTRWGWTLSAIAAVGLLAVGLQSYRSGTVEADSVRGIEDPVTLIAPAADAIVDASEPIHFVWNAVSNSMSYELEVLDADGQVVYTLKTPDTTAIFPDAAGKVNPANSHRWWVKAAMPSGDYLRSAMQAIKFSAE